ncbi:GntR family transcriptional regulator [Labedaea rhizosphaerae]|uniref:GntR family transcriptional regulator n=2 Tax=Labedaea rhizosphaerae TaxID=598644 RepID=A0A4V3CZT3_LABRH|nr:GntR family transcriptional regulator [Labedaea rhizosphaerae]
MTKAGSFEPESERVTRQLRDEILDGARAPGDRLVERDLAADLGVSRVPVRDALRVLVAEGLVTPRPRSWAVVRAFTAADVANLNEVRAAFEPLTFRLAAQRRTDEGVERLRALVTDELAAARAGDAVRARRAAADFHEAVISLAGNDLLAELHGVLRSRLRWLLGQHDDLMAVAEQHEQLCAAIAAGDLALVDELAAAHLADGQRMATARHT